MNGTRVESNGVARRRNDSEHGDPTQSEISMSVVTDVTRLMNISRRSTLLGATEKGRICGVMNVEPILFLISFAAGLAATNNGLFTYWARCIQIAEQRPDLVDNATYTCSLLSGSNGTLQDDVEKDISSMKIYLQIANTIPTLIASPIIGTWSDRNGRKAPLIFATSGMVIYSIIQLLATLTYNQVNVYYWFFAAEFLIGMCGGFITIITTALAIVTDDCRHKLKPGSSTVPFRIGVASFANSIGSFAGSSLETLLVVPATVSSHRHEMSYVKSTFIQSSLSLIVFIYAIFFVRETHFPKRDDFQYNRFDEMDDNEDEEPDQGKKSIFGKFFDLVTSVFGVLSARRPGYTRLCLCFSLVFVFIEFLSFDMALLLLLVKRLPFAWSDKMFSDFQTIKNLIASFGIFVGPLLLTRCHWLGKDSLLIIAAFAASAMTSFAIAFSQSTTQIFYTTGLGVIVGSMGPAYRSFMPRMVAKEETARLLTATTIIISFCPILSALIFNTIFNATLSWWPGFAFFVAGSIQTFVFIGQIVIHCLMRPQWKLDKQLSEIRDGETRTDEGSAFVPEVAPEERSVSNTAVDSDS